MVRTFAGTRHTNGSVPTAILGHADGSVLTGSPATLRKDAAASWNRARKDVAKRTGYTLGLRGWNRTLTEQKRFFFERYIPVLFGGKDARWYRGRRYVRVRGAAAAVPGTSNHGWGLAVDVDDYGGVGQFNSLRRTKTIHILEEHGWTDTEGRAVREPWHLVYDARRDRHKGDKKPAPTITKDWFDMATEAQLRSIVRDELKGVGRQVWGYTNPEATKSDAYYHLLNPSIDAGYLAEAFWRYTLKSRSDDKSYQARTFLTVNNARLNTLLGEALPELFNTLAGLADDSGVSADEMRKQIADVFAGVRLQLVTEADGE